MVVQLDIKPKATTERFEGHEFTCTYDRNAPEEACWVYVIKYTQVYPHLGHAPTHSIARRKAMRKISALNRGRIEMEERGD